MDKAVRGIAFLILTAAALILAACSAGEPSITADVAAMDLGSITNGEIIVRDVIVRNDGQAELVIENVTTSCGCTQASIDPMIIGPDGQARLHIEFDSGFHGPDFAGDLVRQIFIQSNDPDLPEMVVELTVKVTAREAQG